MKLIYPLTVDYNTGSGIFNTDVKKLNIMIEGVAHVANNLEREIDSGNAGVEEIKKLEWISAMRKQMSADKSLLMLSGPDKPEVKARDNAIKSLVNVMIEGVMEYQEKAMIPELRRIEISDVKMFSDIITPRIIEMLSGKL